MVKTGLEVVVGHVRRVVAGLPREQCTDPELLWQFVHGRDAIGLYESGSNGVVRDAFVRDFVSTGFR